MADGTVLPVIVDIEGGIRAGALMNRKAFSKSIETKVLWIVHPETGRVLPWEGDPLYISLIENKGFFSAQLPEGSSPIACELTDGEEDPELHENTALDAEKEKESRILYSLAETIARRKKEMPSGSYTTHLFEKGLEKIRKKVGEEAIELILAVSREDIVYESADLIYHLLVLLEAAGVDFHDLMAELERRDS
ncbi:phosphoribosyl-ATP diphosphatase [Spirochaeta isovalerica]|uniref:Phosphoribosyl-ATP pyrophosphatase n=1 Tax=Spirochaeta isovalerica TaxID=150 RepID=A0A841RH78_9SPIO|nr:phosphoribosyl-ATP diphosphatase [Spirochaeta isovalerica]MBB6482370.1 phosphoribosyl-ATP pyrophosphohydrolase [Spirochaeta isovalerica]